MLKAINETFSIQQVIDYGCCTGANTAKIAKHFPCVGVDKSVEVIEFARTRFPLTEFMCACDPEQFEQLLSEGVLVFLGDVIEHIENDKEFLNKLALLLPTNSRLLITVPAGMELWSKHDESHKHFRRYAQESLSDLLRHANLNMEFISYFNSNLYWPIRFVRTLTRIRRRTFGTNQTDLKQQYHVINGLLEKIFRSECSRLVSFFRAGKSNAFTFGVSLIAVCSPMESTNK